MRYAKSFTPPMMQNTEVFNTSMVRPSTDLGSHKGLPQKNFRQVGSKSLDSRFVSQNMPKDDRALLTSQLDMPSIITNTRPSGLPPTPPMNLQDASGVESDLRAGSGMKQVMPNHITSHSDASTPVNQRSPLTPDSTPPREEEKLLGLQPPMTQRNLSSRTDSFKTAREDQPSSDDESTQPRLASLDGAYDDYEDLTPLAQPRELKLGFDLSRNMNLDDADEDKTPTVERTRIEFGPSHGNRDRENHTKEENHGNPEMEDLTFPSRRGKQSTFAALTGDAPDTVLADTILTDLTSDLYKRIGSSLRERIERNRENADRPSTLKFAEEISWPTTMVSMNPDEDVPATDNKRLSGMSTTSTVIEAYVVDINTPRPRKLRHVGKNMNLRARISSAPAAVSSSGTRPRHKHRLVHKKSNEDMKRASMASDHSPVLNSQDESPHGLPEHIPVMVIPQQRQSLVKSPTESMRTVLSSSPSISPESQPNLGVGYFDLPLRRKKMTGAALTTTRKPQETGEKDHAILKSHRRRSTFSAANSHGTSSTTSFTSVAEGGDLAQVATHCPETASNHIENRGVNGVTQGRNGHIRSAHLAAPITPYSQLSTNSTSEALEVSEARAISIHPHHNNSLLVVQQHSRPVSQDHEQAPVRAVPKSVPELFAEGDSGISASQIAKESPRPPALQVIPPTPDILSPTGEHDRQLGGKSGKAQNVRAGRTLERVKRALSNRRYSDSFLAPFTLFKGVDESTQTTNNHHRRPSLGARKDSKLSPFWRPRGFWDDLEVSDEDIQDEFLERGRVESFERPVSRTRQRSEEDEDGQSRRSSVHRRRAPNNMTMANHHPGGRHVHTFPALGMQIEFIGWKGVQRRLRDIKAAKKVKAQQRERERIKGRISPPTAIDPMTV